MKIAVSRSAGNSLVSSYRELSPEEIVFVSGGDDPGDSSSDGNGGTGDDGTTTSVGPGSAGSLGEVTVSAPAEGNPGGSGIGQTQAQQLMQNIELASQNPFFAFMLMTATLAQAAGNPATPGLPPLGNPMGDPNPMFSSPDGNHGDGP